MHKAASHHAAAHQEQSGVQSLAQGHFHTHSGGAHGIELETDLILTAVILVMPLMSDVIEQPHDVSKYAFHVGVNITFNIQ